MDDNTKTLVAELRQKGLTNGTSLGSHAGICDAAADCIEQLDTELSKLQRVNEIMAAREAYVKAHIKTLSKTILLMRHAMSIGKDPVSLNDAESYRKTMVIDVNSEGERFCPRCQQDVSGYYANYCEHCGQALCDPS